MNILFISSAVLCLLLSLANFNDAKTLPTHLRNLRCHKSDPNIEKCIFEGFEKARPYFVQGIPEVGMPPLDPFFLPLMTVNRTLNEFISIAAICRNVKVTGGANYIIEDVKADIKTMSGELRAKIPWAFLEMEYDVTGNLFNVPLQSKGFFIGNFTDTNIVAKSSFKIVQKKGVDYYRINKIQSKLSVGDGFIQMKSKDPEMQYAADLIANLYNEDPRRVMDAINPIFAETANELFRVIADQILANLPAGEWLPE